MYIKLNNKDYQLMFEDYYLIKVTKDVKIIQVMSGEVETKQIDKYLVDDKSMKAWKH